MLNIFTFRMQNPEFGDEAAYPDEMVRLWLGVMVKMLPADRWGDLLDIGLSLGTAHHLVIAARNQAAASRAPGAVTGIQTSKSVDTVSVSYDVGAVTHESAGFWNMTSYGIQFLNLARMAGAGGVQL